jgi:hypothetical protein
MKLQILSDLHLDFHRDDGIEFFQKLPVVAETAVIAGDLCESTNIVEAMEIVSQKWDE